MIQNVLILGAGSAGLLAAITLKKKLPALTVTVVRSSDIGVIGVGEGTTPATPVHLFEYLQLDKARFYAEAEPTWKLGIRLLWGPRTHFDYTFHQQLDGRYENLSLAPGFYADEDFRGVSIASALMEEGRAFPRHPRAGGAPLINAGFAFHIENLKLVATLEKIAAELGVTFLEGKAGGTERGPQGIAALLLEDGRRLAADFFVDCSGFRSELLGRALEEPFASYDRALFCDRAVVGGWERTTEPILPYTIAETMEAGWAWQIEHEHHINRGYVYCSQAISDEAACEEFLRKNPKAPTSPRVVKFRSGRYQRTWVENVVAIGNSAGFVEPLEASALMVVADTSQTLVQMFEETACAPGAAKRDLFNQIAGNYFDNIRDFLALHYKLNTRLDNAFWKHCREDTELGGLLPLLEAYRKMGPSLELQKLIPSSGNPYGLDGPLVMLLGNRTPYEARPHITGAERATWNNLRATLLTLAIKGLTVKDALHAIRSPQWRWQS